jgi:hypothetical protein
MTSYIIIPSLVSLKALHDVLSVRVSASIGSEKEILNHVIGRLVICGALQKVDEDVDVDRFELEVKNTANGFTTELMATSMSLSHSIATLQGEVFKSIMEEKLEDLKRLLATKHGEGGRRFARELPWTHYSIYRRGKDVESFKDTGREHWSAHDDPETEDMFLRHEYRTTTSQHRTSKYRTSKSRPSSRGPLSLPSRSDTGSSTRTAATM